MAVVKIEKLLAQERDSAWERGAHHAVTMRLCFAFMVLTAVVGAALTVSFGATGATIATAVCLGLFASAGLFLNLSVQEFSRYRGYRLEIARMGLDPDAP